jgi:outer membrane protein
MKHNKFIHQLAGTTLCLLMAWPAMAQRTKALSLNEAIDLSIKNSKQLKLANAKVDEAIATYHDVWNNHLPDVKASGSYLRVSNPTIDLKAKLGSSSSGSDSSKSSGSAIKVNSAAYGMVTATLPVFSGFKIRYGAQSAKYLEQATKLDAENDREEVVQNTISAYSNMYKAMASVTLLKENLKQQQQRVTDFSNLEQNGLLARNDLMKAQLQESNVELSLLDAENNLKITYLNMDLMLGLPEDTDLTPDTTGFVYPSTPGSAIQWEQQAISNRKDMEALSYREKAASTAIKSAKADYYPGIALTGGYLAADIPNFITVTNAFNVGVGLQYNFATFWKTGAKVAEAKARLAQIEVNQEMLSDNIKLQINQAYQNYILSLNKIDVYAKAVAQANENYRITKNKYDNSLVTTTDLLEADVAQLQARLDYTFSKADALVAYKKLQQTAGTIK